MWKLGPSPGKSALRAAAWCPARTSRSGRAQAKTSPAVRLHQTMPTKVFLPLLGVAAFLVGCGKPKQHVSSDLDGVLPNDLPAVYQPFWDQSIASNDERAPRAKLPYDRIALERRSGMATAPDYRVVFHRSGLAELDDQGGSPRGRFKSEIHPASYARLCFIERSRFESLPRDYHYPASDQDTAIVSVASSSGKHTVSEYGEVGPIELWTIQQTIDGLKAGLRWEPVP
jgi:hypothetical protein